MNGRIVKKIRQTVRQAVRRNWEAYYDDIATLPFRNRLRIAWHIITTHKIVKET